MKAQKRSRDIACLLEGVGGSLTGEHLTAIFSQECSTVLHSNWYHIQKHAFIY